jgi:hypothetical protein
VGLNTCELGGTRGEHDAAIFCIGRHDLFAGVCSGGLMDIGDLIPFLRRSAEKHKYGKLAFAMPILDLVG